MMRRLLLRIAEAVLIIQRTAINERTCRIEQEDFCGRRGTQGLRQPGVGITDHFRGELMITDKFRDLITFLSRRCIHQQHRHALLLQILFKSRQLRCQFAADRATGAEQRQHESVFACGSTQLEIFAIQGFQDDVRHHAAHAMFAAFEELRRFFERRIFTRRLDWTAGRSTAAGVAFAQTGEHLRRLIERHTAVFVRVESGEPAFVVQFVLSEFTIGIFIEALEQSAGFRAFADEIFGFPHRLQRFIAHELAIFV